MVYPNASGFIQANLIELLSNLYAYAGTKPLHQMDPDGWMPANGDEPLSEKAEELRDLIEDQIKETLKDVVDAIKDGNPPVGLPNIGDGVIGVGTDHIKNVTDILISSGNDNSPCGKWRRNVFKNTVCARASCSNRGCGDLFSEQINQGNSFARCLEVSLKEANALQQLTLQSGMKALGRHLQKNCNEQPSKSECCYSNRRGEINQIPDGHPKCPNDCTKLRAACKKAK